MPGQGMIDRYRAMEESISIGKVARAGMLTTGNVFFVKDNADTDISDFKRQHPSNRIFTGTDAIQSAITACQSGRNDYIMIAPRSMNAAYAPSAELTLAKDFVHIIGLGRGRQTPKIAFSSTFGVLIGPGGQGIELANLTLLQTGVGAVTPNYVLKTADATVEDLYLAECTLELSAASAIAATSEINDASVRPFFDRCRIGSRESTADADHSQAYIQTVVGKNAHFRECVFGFNAQDITDTFALFGAAAGSFNVMERCIFLNEPSVLMSVGVTTGGTTNVLLSYCTMLGLHATTGTAGDANVLFAPVSPPAAAAGENPGIAALANVTGVL